MNPADSETHQPKSRHGWERGGRGGGEVLEIKQSKISGFCKTCPGTNLKKLIFVICIILFPQWLKQTHLGEKGRGVGEGGGGVFHKTADSTVTDRFIV